MIELNIFINLKQQKNLIIIKKIYIKISERNEIFQKHLGEHKDNKAKIKNKKSTQLPFTFITQNYYKIL